MEEYTAINGNTLLNDSNLEFDLYLRSGSNGHSKYVLFCRGKDGFSQERKEELLSRNIESFILPQRIEENTSSIRKETSRILSMTNPGVAEKNQALFIRWHRTKY